MFSFTLSRGLVALALAALLPIILCGQSSPSPTLAPASALINRAS